MAAAGNGGQGPQQSLLGRVWELHGGKLSFAGGALLALGAYKLFRESEADLERRLLRYRRGKKKIRIYIDGCWDLMHFGHANAFRQARELGDELVVGINMSWEIEQVKGGPPIMSDEERRIAVAGCKWVDEVIDNAPYTMTPEFLEKLFNEHKIDYVVHGDDPCFLPDGTDVYAAAKAAGRFKTIRRTEGVSTTDIVGRMLVMNRAHHRPLAPGEADQWAVAGDFEYQLKHGFSRPSNFLPTTHRLREFSNNRRPKPDDRIVYIDGAFDMFHAGHVEILEKAKASGDYLIVGVVSDEAVNAIRGANYPILNLHERCLSVLSCRYVDEVIIGAPWKPSKALLKSLNVSLVVHGEVTDDSEPLQQRGPAWKEHYEAAKELEIPVKQLSSVRMLTTRDIVQRIFENRDQFESKYAKKKQQEVQYEENKEFVPEI